MQEKQIQTRCATEPIPSDKAYSGDDKLTQSSLFNKRKEMSGHSLTSWESVQYNFWKHGNETVAYLWNTWAIHSLCRRDFKDSLFHSLFLSIFFLCLKKEVSFPPARAQPPFWHILPVSKSSRSNLYPVWENWLPVGEAAKSICSPGCLPLFTPRSAVLAKDLLTKHLVHCCKWELEN